MKKTSIWRDTAEASEYECLSQDINCDVAIVGGGITGLTAAYLLKQAGLKSVVLEALRIGGGTTGFSTGNLYCTVDEYLHTIEKKYDMDKVQSVVQSRTEAINLIKSIVREYNIDCELLEVPFYLFAEKEEYAEKVEKEAATLQKAGLSVSVEREFDLPFPIARVMKLERQAQFNPMKYVKQLAKNIHSNACTIYEGTKVTEYKREEGGVYVVKTATGATVRANKIIMATHTPKGILGIQLLIFPYREYAVAFDNSKGTFHPGIYWQIDGENKHSIRHYQNGDQNYLLVLGEKHKVGQKENNTENIENLKKYTIEKFKPGLQQYQWGAQHYRASDGLATVGKADKDSEVYMATGFSTDGLTYGTMAAQIITDLITGKDNPYAATYDPHRHHPLQSAPSTIKENVNVLMQYVKDLPFKGDVKDAEHVKRGEGKVIAQDGEKLAVYRDEQDHLHVCSAVCTHMDCIVNWNEAERSWDCPCHGSRFNYDGTVLEGPAISDLPKKSCS